MTHDKLAKVLQVVRPNTHWNLRGEHVEWLDQNVVPPTSEELQAGEKIVDQLAYREQRMTAYPLVGDQLDAIWKYLGTQQLTPEAEEMKQRVMNVKAQFPKPEGL